MQKWKTEARPGLGTFVKTESGACICDITALENRKAIALLIAAAPEMEEALKAWQSFDAHYCETCHNGRGYCYVAGELRLSATLLTESALNKARGAT